jgi:hypothetical protein
MGAGANASCLLSCKQPAALTRPLPLPTGSPAPVAPAAEAACSLLHHALATNLLSWTAAPEALESLGLGPLAEGCPGGLPDLIWRASARALGAPIFMGSALDVAGLVVPGQFRLAPGARRSLEVPLASPPLTPRGQQGGDSSGGGAAGDGRPSWQQALERGGAATRSAAPRALRLLWALHMAAAAAAVVAEAAAARAEQEAGDAAAPLGFGPADGEAARHGGALAMQLVLPSGQLLQARLQQRAAGAQQGADSGAAEDELLEGLAAVFCRVIKVRRAGRCRGTHAVWLCLPWGRQLGNPEPALALPPPAQGWAPQLLAVGASPEERAAHLQALLHLVLQLALSSHDACQQLGCAAARALMQAAAAAGVGQLHLLTPMLLQVCRAVCCAAEGRCLPRPRMLAPATAEALAADQSAPPDAVSF